MKDLLRNIIAAPQLFGRLLNTLSLLEYIGARKILKSQDQVGLNVQVLAHASEEIRHSLILKKAALKYAPDCENYSEENLLCGQEACDYFQAIDHAAGIELNEHDPWYAYLYTTYLIETRALDFYAGCEEILKEAGLASVFRGILVEEDRHLHEIQTWMATVPNHVEKIARLQAVEQQQFNQWVSVCRKEIEKCSATV